MPLVTTPAAVLHVMPYRETSKILRLLTRDLGLQSAIARGARRAKSATGPRLDLFTIGNATLFVREARELAPLTGFESTVAHAGISRDVRRFGAAAALAEIALKCAPAEQHPAVFDAVAAGLDVLDRAEGPLVEAAALAACWALVVALGFEPSLDRCAVCGTPAEASGAFSAALGGVLCSRHKSEGARHTRLAEQDRAALAALLVGRWPDPPLDARHAAAHRRLLLAFIRHHLAEDRPLPAMAFWDRESWNATSL